MSKSHNYNRYMKPAVLLMPCLNTAQDTKTHTWFILSSLFQQLFCPSHTRIVEGKSLFNHHHETWHLLLARWQIVRENKLHVTCISVYSGEMIVYALSLSVYDHWSLYKRHWAVNVISPMFLCAGFLSMCSSLLSSQAGHPLKHPSAGLTSPQCQQALLRVLGPGMRPWVVAVL